MARLLTWETEASSLSDAAKDFGLAFRVAGCTRQTDTRGQCLNFEPSPAGFGV